MPLIRYALKHISSKWLILLIELALVMTSLTATMLVFEVVTNQNFIASDVIKLSLIGGILAVTGSLFFHTHQDIIRYSDITDIVKVLMSVLFGFITWNLVLYLGKDFFDTPLPHSMVLVHSSISALKLIAFRVIVREVHFRTIKRLKERNNILIYGAGEKGISIKKAIQSDANNKNNIVGMIDDNPEKVGKTIGGIRVHSSDHAILEKLVLDYKIKTIIIAADHLSTSNKFNLSDFCMRHKIVLKYTPPMQEWTEGVIRTSQLKNITIEHLLERPVIRVLNDRTMEEMRDKVILVTGAAGSIGSEICRLLASYPIREIIALDQSETGLFELSNEMSNKYEQVKLLPILASIRDEKRLKLIMSTYKPDMVFHAAAYKHVPLLEEFPAEVVKTNIFGTLNVLKAALNQGVSKFIMVSTDKAVNPTNLMGASKRLAELLVQYYNNDQMNCIITRFGNVLGSNGSVVPIFRKQIESGGPVTVTHQDITRYFMTIPEASNLVIEAATMGSSNEIFVFDMGEPVRILDLAKKMIRLSGLEPHRDVEIAITGLRPGEKLYEELFRSDEMLKTTHHPKIMLAEANTKLDLNLELYINRFEAAISEEGCNEQCLRDLFTEIIPELRYTYVVA